MSEDNKDNLPVKTTPNGGAKPLSHTKDGKFAKGNKLGKGNPFGHEVNKLRAYIFGNITEGDWDKIRQALIKKAMAGDTKALYLLMSYTLGKPAQQVDINMTAAQISPEEAKKRIASFFGLNYGDK